MPSSIVICFSKVRSRQRLIERLHPEFVLSGLHRRIKFVNFVFADQVADGGIRNHDLMHIARPFPSDLGRRLGT